MPGYLVVTLTNSKGCLCTRCPAMFHRPCSRALPGGRGELHSRSLRHSQCLTLWVLSIGSVSVCSSRSRSRLFSQTAGVYDAERFRLAFSLTWQTGWRKQAGRRRFSVGLTVGRPAADASTAPAPPAASRFVAAAAAAAETAGGAISASGAASAGEAHVAASCLAAPATVGTLSAAGAASPQGGCSQAAAVAGVQAFPLPQSRWQHPCDGTGMRSRPPPPAPVATRRRCLPRATFECCSRPCCMAESMEARSYVRQHSS